MFDKMFSEEAIENFKIALEIMGKGMGGIFATIIIIMIIIMIIAKFSGGKKDKKQQ